MITRSALLVPAAIVIAGTATATGIAPGGDDDGASGRAPSSTTATAAGIEISAGEAGDRFESLAADRRLGAPMSVSYAACAPTTASGTFKCILDLRRANVVEGAAVPPGADHATQLYQVTFASSEDTEPTYSHTGSPTREDLREIRGAGSGARSTATTPAPSRSARDETESCGDITTAKSEGVFVGDIEAHGIPCDEARYVVAGFAHLDPDTGQEPDTPKAVDFEVGPDGSYTGVRYTYEGEQHRMDLTTPTPEDPDRPAVLTDDRGGIRWQAGPP